MKDFLVSLAANLSPEDRRVVGARIQGILGPGSPERLVNLDKLIPSKLDLKGKMDHTKALALVTWLGASEIDRNPEFRERLFAIANQQPLGFTGDVPPAGTVSEHEAMAVLTQLMTNPDFEKLYLERQGHHAVDGASFIKLVSQAWKESSSSKVGASSSPLTGEVFNAENFEGGTFLPKVAEVLRKGWDIVAPGVASAVITADQLKKGSLPATTPSSTAPKAYVPTVQWPYPSPYPFPMPSTTPKDPTVGIDSQLSAAIAEMQVGMATSVQQLKDRTVTLEKFKANLGRVTTALSALKSDDVMAQALEKYPIDFSTPDSLGRTLRPFLESSSPSLGTRIREWFGGGDPSDDYFSGYDTLQGDVKEDFLSTVGANISGTASAAGDAVSGIWKGMTPGGKTAAIAGSALLAGGGLIKLLGPTIASYWARANGGNNTNAGPNSQMGFTESQLKAVEYINSEAGGAGISSDMGASPASLLTLYRIGKHLSDNAGETAFMVGPLAGDVQPTRLEGVRYAYPTEFLTLSGDVIPAPYFNGLILEEYALEGGFLSGLKGIGSAIGKVGGALLKSPIGKIGGSLLKAIPGVGTVLSLASAGYAIADATGAIDKVSAMIGGDDKADDKPTTKPAIKASVTQGNHIGDNLAVKQALVDPEFDVWIGSAPEPLVGEPMFEGGYLMNATGSTLLKNISDWGSKACSNVAGYISSPLAPTSKSWLTSFWSWIKAGGSWFMKRGLGTKVAVAIGLYSLAEYAWKYMTSPNPANEFRLKTVFGSDYPSFNELMSKQKSGNLNEEERVTLSIYLARLSAQSPEVFADVSPYEQAEVAATASSYSSDSFLGKVGAGASTDTPAALNNPGGAASDYFAPSVSTDPEAIPEPGSEKGALSGLLGSSDLVSKLESALPVIIAIGGTGLAAYLVSKAFKKSQAVPEAVIPVSFMGSPEQTVATLVKATADVPACYDVELLARQVAAHLIARGYKSQQSIDAHKASLDFMSQL